MRKMNWYGTILTEKYYILPEVDSLQNPIIKTPVVLSSYDEIRLEFPTQEDAKVKFCPSCKSKVIHALLQPPRMDVAYWRCLICGYGWETDRGIIYEMQMTLF